MPRTVFEKIWDRHVVRDLGDGWALLHDLSGPPALIDVARRGLAVLFPGERRLHERPNLVGEEAGVLVEALQLRAVQLCERRFIVPGVHVAGAAVDEQPDDAFGAAVVVAVRDEQTDERTRGENTRTR